MSFYFVFWFYTGQIDRSIVLYMYNVHLSQQSSENVHLAFFAYSLPQSLQTMCTVYINFIFVYCSFNVGEKGTKPVSPGLHLRHSPQPTPCQISSNKFCSRWKVINRLILISLSSLLLSSQNVLIYGKKYIYTFSFRY